MSENIWTNSLPWPWVSDVTLIFPFYSMNGVCYSVLRGISKNCTFCNIPILWVALGIFFSPKCPLWSVLNISGLSFSDIAILPRSNSKLTWIDNSFWLEKYGLMHSFSLPSLCDHSFNVRCIISCNIVSCLIAIFIYLIYYPMLVWFLPHSLCILFAGITISVG